jgi:uncharacterized protein (TIGR04222 family)
MRRWSWGPPKSDARHPLESGIRGRIRPKHKDMVIALYLAFAAAAYLLVKAYRLQADGSGRLPTPMPPRTVDPIDLAYLRAGRSAALRVSITDLAERELIVLEGTMIARGTFAKSKPEDSLEFAIYDALRHGRKSYLELETAVDGPLTTRLANIVSWTEADELLMPEHARSRTAIIAGFLAFALIAAAVIAAPLDARASGMAPFYYAVAAIGGLAAVWYASRVPRLSDRGKRFLIAVEQNQGR